MLVNEYLSNMLLDSVKCSLDENDETKVNIDINFIKTPKLEKEEYYIKFIKNKFNLNIKKRSVWLSYKSILDFISKYYPQDYYDVEKFIYTNI